MGLLRTGWHVIRLITVISTGFNAPTKGRCIKSVASQKGVDFEHIYIEAAEQNPPKSAMQNLYETAHSLSPENIICCVDGDDWLSYSRALARVNDEYKDPDVWLTYGSFICADGRPGFAAAYEPHESPRKTYWRATHLKTYRAGLFQKIPKSQIFDGVNWQTHVLDGSVMFPMMEMATHKHYRFIPDILYVYNWATSLEWNADPAVLKDQEDAVAELTSRPELKPIDSWK